MAFLSIGYRSVRDLNAVTTHQLISTALVARLPGFLPGMSFKRTAVEWENWARGNAVEAMQMVKDAIVGSLTASCCIPLAHNVPGEWYSQAVSVVERASSKNGQVRRKCSHAVGYSGL